MDTRDASRSRAARRCWTRMLVLGLVVAALGVAARRSAVQGDLAFAEQVRRAGGELRLESSAPGWLAQLGLSRLPVVEARLPGARVAELRMLRRFPRLRVLDLEGSRHVDLHALAHPERLEVLRLDGVPLTDVAPLAKFQRLQELSLLDTKIADLSPLGKLPALRVLRCSSPQLLLTTLADGFPALQELDLSDAQASNLQFLANQRTLQVLRLRGASLTSLETLPELPALRELDLGGTQIRDLTPLKRLMGLESLNLDDVPLVDLSPLAELPELASLSLRRLKLAARASTEPRLSLEELLGPQGPAQPRVVALLAPLARSRSLRTIAISGDLPSDWLATCWMPPPEVMHRLEQAAHQYAVTHGLDADEAVGGVAPASFEAPLPLSAPVVSSGPAASPIPTTDRPSDAVTWNGLPVMSDLEQAVDLARDHGRLVLVHFCDGAPACLDYERNVLNQSVVGTAVREHYIPVRIRVDEGPLSDECRQLFRQGPAPASVVIDWDGRALQSIDSDATADGYAVDLNAIFTRFAAKHSPAGFGDLPAQTGDEPIQTAYGVPSQYAPSQAGYPQSQAGYAPSQAGYAPYGPTTDGAMPMGAVGKGNPEPALEDLTPNSRQLNIATTWLRGNLPQCETTEHDEGSLDAVIERLESSSGREREQATALTQPLILIFDATSGGWLPLLAGATHAFNSDPEAQFRRRLLELAGGRDRNVAASSLMILAAAIGPDEQVAGVAWRRTDDALQRMVQLRGEPSDEEEAIHPGLGYEAFCVYLLTLPPDRSALAPAVTTWKRLMRLSQSLGLDESEMELQDADLDGMWMTVSLHAHILYLSGRCDAEVPTLLTLTDSQELPYYRVFATLALCMIGPNSPGVHERLEQLARDPHPAVRKAARHSLEYLSGEASSNIEQNIQWLGEWRSLAERASAAP